VGIKVGWVHDYSLKKRFGGAQLTNETIIEGAPKSVKVARCYPGNVQAADVYILNNIKFFSERELTAFLKSPHIKFEHDHWDTPQAWQKKYIKPIYNSALGAIFLSPLHKRTFLDIHNVLPAECECIPSPVDPGRFWADPGKRGVVWLGEYASHKGIKQACAWAENHQTVVKFWGWGDEPPRGPYTVDCGRAPYSLVPSILAEARALLFLPVWYEAFGRIVAEATFSGCEIIGNENIGALSWGLDREGLAEACKDSPAKFWGIVKEWV
jgi:glycosyltransferase involved in cell wall biosynthesis